ncbi:MAG: ATPase, T2SS/T4P/T4SS family [Elusimicrobia bacterium]|nr:ATPase, T2SS/T4P/T4SS family [Elusimicrobiota bacterium]
MGKIISLFDNQDISQRASLGVNLAMALAEQSREKIVFVDLSMSENGTIEHLTGIKPEKSILDLMSVLENINETLIKGYIPFHSSGVAFIEGIPKSEASNLNPEKISEALKMLSKVFPYTLVLMPDDYGLNLSSICAVSNLILISVYPHMISLPNAKTFLGKLGEWHFPIQIAKGIYISIDSKNAIDRKKIADYLGIDIFGEVPYDMEGIITSINKGVAQITADPHSKFSIAIKQFAKSLLKNSIYIDTKSGPNISKTGPSKDEKEVKNNFDSLKLKIHRELLAEFGAKKIDIKEFSDKNKSAQIREMTRKTIQEIIARQEVSLSREERERIVNEIIDEALGLGCLEKFLKDTEVTEIMVNGPHEIYIEKKGKIYLSDEHFLSNDQLMTVIDRIVSPIGRRVDESSPIVDARLSDGSRVNAIIPPLSLVGPTLTIRKFSHKKLIVEDLIEFGALNNQMAEFLRICVQLRKNIVVSGGTGSGKTTLLNVISSFIPSDERIVTIEDSAELKLPQKHVVRLESRPPSIEGKGEVPIRRLVINALRMRPDRIVVGECRGGETLDMLQAMNTGHDGSMTTIHANSPKDGISRLTTMVIMAGTELPEKAIREQIASAVQIIVQLSRLSDGSRKIVDISEVAGIKNDAISLTGLFKYEQTAIKDGKVTGKFIALGNKPSFIDEIEVHGLKLDRSMFKEGVLI